MKKLSLFSYRIVFILTIKEMKLEGNTDDVAEATFLS